MGRFLSVDPILTKQVGDEHLLPVSLFISSELHNYAYVRNNPINYSDPFGFQAIPCPKPQLIHYRPVNIGEGGSLYEECVRSCDESYRVNSDICASLPCPQDRAKCYAEAAKEYAACLRFCYELK